MGTRDSATAATSENYIKRTNTHRPIEMKENTIKKAIEFF